MAKPNKPSQSAPNPSIDIGALCIQYPGRSDETEIPDDRTRLPLNASCRALDGMTAIVKILYSDSIERQAVGADATTLSTTITNGLFEALLLLADQGNANATALGEELFQRERGGRQS